MSGFVLLWDWVADSFNFPIGTCQWTWIIFGADDAIFFIRFVLFKHRFRRLVYSIKWISVIRWVNQLIHNLSITSLWRRTFWCHLTWSLIIKIRNLLISFYIQFPLHLDIYRIRRHRSWLLRPLCKHYIFVIVRHIFFFAKIDLTFLKLNNSTLVWNLEYRGFLLFNKFIGWDLFWFRLIVRWNILYLVTFEKFLL